MKAPVIVMSIVITLANTVLLCYADDAMTSVPDVFTAHNLPRALLYFVSLFLAFIGLYYIIRRFTRSALKP